LAGFAALWDVDCAVGFFAAVFTGALFAELFFADFFETAI
jgi:hypothetical protein